MEDRFRTPSHLVVKGGSLLKNTEEVGECTPPKVVHYNHTVRLLPGACDHEWQMERLRRLYESEITQKDGEIKKLRLIMEDKENEGSNKFGIVGKLKENQSSFGRFLMPPETSQFDLSFIEANGQSQQISMNQSKISHTERRVSDFQTLFPEPEPEAVVDDQVNRVKEEMKSTMEVLSNITDLINKPRKKYQFYNTNFEKADLKEIHQNFQLQEEKKLDQTNLQITDNQLNSSFSEHKIIVNCENIEPEYSELDQTTSDEKMDTATFLEETVKEHEKLKQILIDLQNSTKMEIEEMKTYYEGEIQNYISILGQEKGKNSVCNLNSTRSNIEGQVEVKSELELQEEEVEEMAWNGGSKFEIIFPQESILTPDLLE